MPARKKFDKLIPKAVQTESDTNNQSAETTEAKSSRRKIHTYLFRPAEPKFLKNKVYAVGFIDVFVPFLVSFVLVLINRFLTNAGTYDSLGETASLIINCIIPVLVFIVPVIIFCWVRKKSLHKELSLHRFSPSYLPFIFFGLMLLILSIAVERIAIAYFFPDEAVQNHIYMSTYSNKSGILIAYAVMPAVCEEFFLRGLVQNEISEKAGGLAGILVSSIAFALLHLDFKYFTVYFTSGLILSICAHVTNSVIPSIGLHILNNAFSIVFASRLSFIASERTGNSFLIIILIFILFLLMLFYLKSLESICTKKAYIEDIKNSPDSEKSDGLPINRMYYRNPYKLFSSSGYTLHKLFRVLFSPALIIAAILFLFAVI